MRGKSAMCVWTTVNGKNAKATIHVRPTCRMLNQEIGLSLRAHRRLATVPLRPTACQCCSREGEPQTTETQHGLASALLSHDSVSAALDDFKPELAADGGGESYSDTQLMDHQEARDDA